MTKPERSDQRADGPVKGRAPRTNPSLPTGGLRSVTLSPADASAGKKGRGADLSDDDVHDPYVGATIDGRYYVESQLGEGGMGVVYLCRHTIIDKQVAMKVLRADMARNEEVTERFLNEARSASSIGNPHIIDISDFGRLPDGATYFVMEFLTGTPMAELAEAAVALAPARVVHIGIQLTEGLAAAHDAGIVHRDLKPDNIFLVKQGSETDFIKILDFGIAKASTNATKLTQAGQVFGTPHYMSPEQAAGSEVDHRSDIYAVGVILYELSTGALPFDAENFMAILTQHMYKAPIAPSAVEGLPHELPFGLEDIILKCMEKAPEQRYQTMAELGGDLRSIFAGGVNSGTLGRHSLSDAYSSSDDYFERTSGAGVTAPSVTDARPRRSNLPLLVGIGSVAALAAASIVWSLSGSKEEPESEPEPLAVETPAPDEEETAIAIEEIPLPRMSQVAIAIAPLKAHVFNGDKDLGQSPVMVDVGDEPLELEGRLKGYKTYKFSVDGTDAKVSIELEKKGRAKAPRWPSPASSATPAPRPAPKPKSIGGGELVNPWD